MKFQRRVLQSFAKVFYKIILLFSSSRRIVKKYKVCICATFKNEAVYLREWIEYHELIGVEHFYLYNNFSDDNYQKVLKKYVDSGLVTLVEFPVKQGQILAYKDCIKKHAAETEWLGFIDIDEFIVPVKDYNIFDFLNRFRKYPSVVMNWKSFGTSGLMDRNLSELVIESFNVCQPGYFMGKSFYNTKFSYNENSRFNQTSMNHFFWGKIGFVDIPPVNADKKLYFGKYMDRLNKSKKLAVQLNHYYSKSVEEYKAKIKRGDAIYKVCNYGMDKVIDVDKKATESEYTIYKYLIALKLKLNEQEI